MFLDRNECYHEPSELDGSQNSTMTMASTLMSNRRHRSRKLLWPVSVAFVCFARVTSLSYQYSPSRSQSRLTVQSAVNGDNDGLPTPFFATKFVEQTSASTSSVPEGKAASITTRLPLGKLFDSREFIFNTATNVRGYEWTIKETEELIEDLLDASLGIMAKSDDNDEKDEALFVPRDYELSQIVLIPMDWDRDRLGLGCRYDVHDGQQRLVTLCLIFAALRQTFLKDTSGDAEETAQEISNMLLPPKVRKDDVLRIELNPRDNEVLSGILQGKIDSANPVAKTKLSKLSRANNHVWNNFQRIGERIETMPQTERLKFLDFLIENVWMLVCIPENAAIARNIVMGQGKGKDNEVIDDFKGLVCFRYTPDEQKMYQTFDRWDELNAIPDLDTGAVGREIVADACVLRATSALRTKIGRRNQLFALEQWLRKDLSTSNNSDGSVFFSKVVQPASLCLGQFREGTAPPFGFTRRGKISKTWPCIERRLAFLREMITLPAAKDIEIVVLELLLRADGSICAMKPMPMDVLEAFLKVSEQYALWSALVKPTAKTRFQKCFQLLDAINSNDSSIQILTKEEKSEIGENLVNIPFGASASGKKLVTALLKRLNYEVLATSGSGEAAPVSYAASFLEPVLPVKATKKAWGEDWPEKRKREIWMHQLGNLCLTSQKVSAKDAKQSFEVKKERYKNEDQWPLTKSIGEFEKWDSNSIIKNLSMLVSRIETTWG